VLETTRSKPSLLYNLTKLSLGWRFGYTQAAETRYSGYGQKDIVDISQLFEGICDIIPNKSIAEAHSRNPTTSSSSMSHNSELLCTKFLAPAKVALIALIHVYCSHEIRTSSRVTLLMLLLKWTDGKDTCLSLFGLSDFKAHLSDIPCVDGGSTYDRLLLKVLPLEIIIGLGS
jgi:hypothetical protein